MEILHRTAHEESVEPCRRGAHGGGGPIRSGHELFFFL